MAKFIIPKAVVENESAAQREDVFPKGTWEGTIEKVYTREIVDGDGGDFFLKNRNGVTFADSCLLANLQIGSNSAVLEGQPSVGESKYFDSDLMLQLGLYNWDDPVLPESDEYWRLRVTQVRLTKLASALNLAEETEEGIGPVDDFHNLLVETNDDPAGGLNGMVVRFKVDHRIFKKKDGSQGREARTVQYYPAE